RRAGGARARDRRPPHGRVRALRALARVPEDRALDEQRAGGRPAHLRAGRLRPRARGAPPELPPRPDRGDLGAGAILGPPLPRPQTYWREGGAGRLIRSQPRRISPVLPVLAAVATGVQVGSAMVATRFVVDQTGPASLALLRYAIGAGCLLPP